MKNSVNVVFCIPGQSFSNTFLQCWTDLLLYCPTFGVKPICPVFPYISNVYISRNVCLLGNPGDGVHQKPFRGRIDYDFMMWIDSDSVFTPDDFKRLLSLMLTNQHIHILSGVYMHGSEEAITTINSEGTLITPEELQSYPELKDVPFTGMGFMMVRRGVFEYLPYPWFIPILKTDDQGNVIDIMGDDVAFCERAQRLGFKTWITPTVKIGHEKLRILQVP